jgi:hypothetical protein
VLRVMAPQIHTLLSIARFEPGTELRPVNLEIEQEPAELRGRFGRCLRRTFRADSERSARRPSVRCVSRERKRRRSVFPPAANQPAMYSIAQRPKLF